MSLTNEQLTDVCKQALLAFEADPHGKPLNQVVLEHIAAKKREVTTHVVVPVLLLKKIHRDLDACQKVIWLGMPHADPAYCEDAKATLREIEELLK